MTHAESLTQQMPPRVVAVVVLYRPELARLQQVLTALTPQVEQVVLVHNGATTVGGTGRSAAPEAEWLEDWLNRLPLQRERICYLPQTSNIGLAAAQNLGLAQARVLQAEFVLLCDQDSVAAPDMVEALLRGHAELTAAGHAVAAVGPVHGDERLAQLSPFVRAEGWRMVRAHCDASQPWVRCDHVIASGSLIAMDRLAQVGEMEAGLFIDLVDIEWCYRARQFGAACYGICDARMHHVLGDAPSSIFGRPVAQRMPLRHFYLFRNTVLLFGRRYVPWAWKCSEAVKLLARFGINALFRAPRWAGVRMMTAGIWHGLRGISGPYRA